MFFFFLFNHINVSNSLVSKGTAHVYKEFQARLFYLVTDG